MHVPSGSRPRVDAPEDDLAMQALLRAEDGAGLSLTRVELAGRHRPLRTERSVRTYYVLEGSATFTVGGRELEAGAGDVVVIPRGELYDLRGELTYLVLNTPPYVEGDDLYEETT